MTEYINSKKLIGIPPGRGSNQQGARHYEHRFNSPRRPGRRRCYSCIIAAGTRRHA
jgi:hypothetical protein